MPGRTRLGFSTDTSIPFFDVVKRPAWELVFDGVEVSITTRDGTQHKNRNITTITVLIDAETGALLKVSSPKPAAGGVTEEPGAAAAERTTASGLMLKSTPGKPGIPFMQALKSPKLTQRGLVPEAGQVVAYFGLLTDILRPENGINDKPYWIVFLGGVKKYVFHGCPGEPTPPGPATQAMVVLDAETGNWYYARYSDRGS